MFLKKKENTDLAERLAWVRLIRTENIGPVTFYQLIDSYGSAQKALQAVPELAARGGRSKPLFIPYPAVIEKEYDALKKIGGDIVTAADDAYPAALAALPDAPPVLSVRGNIDLLRRPAIAIVGARNASLNGKKFAASLARDLGAAGQAVVSGLARGIDTAAHEGSLDTGTIAVVAGGIDIVYPPENRKLYDAIVDRGLVVAESPLGQQPFAQSFPRRNRIVSGLSSGVVVAEATLKSGSLITARLAGEQGRDLYAVPGHPLDPRAAGPNHLIREGAILIRGAADILDNLSALSTIRGLSEPESGTFRHGPLSAAQDTRLFDQARGAVLDHLSPVPLAVDELVRATQTPVPLILTVLLELELAGRVQRLPGNRVALLTDQDS